MTKMDCHISDEVVHNPHEHDATDIIYLVYIKTEFEEHEYRVNESCKDYAVETAKVLASLDGVEFEQDAITVFDEWGERL